ncbi:MAG: prolyl-tRNA synthetase [Candidatus Kerfeldbacteria bacterium]|nr:prolyl-tRNA synthetase [Candidatus Kerfeldbacteria bacterium]
MRQSILFPKTARTAPKDEVSRNAQLLEQAGYISKLFAGVYSYLPLGFRVLRKIEKIIREEMDLAGGQELFMPALHPLENYQQTGRADIDVLFHLEMANGKKLVLGQSHEEVIVPLFKKYIQSYKDLPRHLYQIQTKFRNELRAKSGILRGREFMMKDLYSFHTTEEDLLKYYDRMRQAYERIFMRAGIGHLTHYTFASGGTFSEFSHEFQTITSAGEDTIHVCEKCGVAINDELITKYQACPECNGRTFAKHTAIEVGNIFPLKTKFSEKFDLSYTSESGTKQLVVMGCYGIGLGRLMGAVVEVRHDDKGIYWPRQLAPFQVHLVNLNQESGATADTVYNQLLDQHIEVLYDDRDESAGVKFGDADLIGIPIRLVISKKTAQQVELSHRGTRQGSLMSVSSAIKEIERHYV